MHALAASAGLAPEVVLARPEEGVLVTAHASGRALERADLRDPVMLGRIGCWMAQLHALQPPAGLSPIVCGARAAASLATAG
jgi:hypothetical protein